MLGILLADLNKFSRSKTLLVLKIDGKLSKFIITFILNVPLVVFCFDLYLILY